MIVKNAKSLIKITNVSFLKIIIKYIIEKNKIEILANVAEKKLSILKSQIHRRASIISEKK